MSPDASGRVTLNSRRDAQSDGGRLAIERAGRAPEGVDQRSLHLVDRFRGQICVAQSMRVVAQEFGRRVHETPPAVRIGAIVRPSRVDAARGSR